MHAHLILVVSVPWEIDTLPEDETWISDGSIIKIIRN